MGEETASSLAKSQTLREHDVQLEPTTPRSSTTAEEPTLIESTTLEKTQAPLTHLAAPIAENNTRGNSRASQRFSPKTKAQAETAVRSTVSPGASRPSPHASASPRDSRSTAGASGSR